ncbi:MAG TPA: polyhydroxyalkanoate synthesis regulator DNA-binding domain-containing protein [Polyangiaceae bacterium]|nr:polyhydroxyalkanoate synthesis regulator DNA-binding domain-containing protein [Polyangiaceae bacterium]
MVSEVPESGSTGERRVIKRYSNRKLYDTKDSRYVTLLQIAEMIRANEDVQIIDNATKEDKTDVTLALIISEELKARPRGIPLATLKALIRQRSEKILTHFRDSPIRRLITKEHPEEGGEVGEVGPGPLPEEDDVTGSETHQKGLRATLEQWQHAIDERIRAVLPNFSPIRELQSELKRVSDRLAAIEKRLEEKAKE